MVAVVGDCQDCIVSLPVQPDHTMLVDVKVSFGQNLVMRNLGVFRSNYAPVSPVSQVEQYYEIPAGATVQFPTGYSVLFISTDKPVQLSSTISNVPAEITKVNTVNKLLLVDEQMLGFSITNPSPTTGEGSYTAKVQLMYQPFISA
jgi:hypothetical protein